MPHHGKPDELLLKLARARELVPIGGQYRHRNGGVLYRVEAIVLREEDLAPAVVYRTVEGPPVSWDRKLDVFLDRFHRVEFPPLPSVATED